MGSYKVHPSAGTKHDQWQERKKRSLLLQETAARFFPGGLKLQVYSENEQYLDGVCENMLLLPSDRLSVLAFPARGQQGITVLIATATYLFFWSEMNMSSVRLSFTTLVSLADQLGQRHQIGALTGSESVILVLLA